MMAGKICDKSGIVFSEALGSSEPVPGGGGAAAYVGALGAALGMMVGNLTLGKKKYADVEAEIQDTLKKLDALRIELIDLVDEDAKSFLPLSKAYGMPKDTSEQQAEKAVVMEKALSDACIVPLRIMQCCAEVIELQRIMAEKGSALARSDAGAGVICAKGAMQAASLNIFINAKSMTDRAKADSVSATAQRLLEKYCPLADEVFEYVRREIS